MPSTVSSGRPMTERRSACRMVWAPWLTVVTRNPSSKAITPDDRLDSTLSR
ncbi:Uncharacterised protein [Bordetella pertussis]|nr:Uncharacterised protein [Bordetella pertussis]